ncbi:hypothetical protein JG687_00014742 [Phytophthora cactorum]|uniref:Uncharacterized protein n=1 Tax=Phytophthora cactorum TaxID=29920 RepID=A0A329SQ56_9STRA|nr:hypothetical protein Pcac1_g4908 [Phytophthora cactorum]KAG2801148.1 hypothetical protein PC111_g19664 [Phytophthora cactorum]KAG2820068.1 hypothetical protein PC112_g11919 [Phytophthora cactorum]KAG2858930.1 hypothetical protein PC113_g9366 [Phytophthora cactorum]KAG2909780.1 hypothetical protein PC114_g9974 [Phytophthora cactorum]
MGEPNEGASDDECTDSYDNDDFLELLDAGSEQENAGLDYTNAGCGNGSGEPMLAWVVSVVAGLVKAVSMEGVNQMKKRAMCLPLNALTALTMMACSGSSMLGTHKKMLDLAVMPAVQRMSAEEVILAPHKVKAVVLIVQALVGYLREALKHRPMRV